MNTPAIRSLAFAALLAVAVAPLAGQAAKKAYKAPRTTWGDPDLQGVWPGTDFVGVPLQRAASFGERNVLTEQEYQDRQAAAARQNDEDNAEFNIEAVTAEQEARGTVGGPVSPPPHWLERGKPSYQPAHRRSAGWTDAAADARSRAHDRATRARPDAARRTFTGSEP